MTWMPRVRLCLLAVITASAAFAAPSTRPSEESQVGRVPAELREALALGSFYQQHLSAGGFPIIASQRVNPHALREAAYLIDHMLANRPDIRATLVSNRVRLSVMAVTERTTDVPEHADLKPKAHWDRRARGLGATRKRPCVSCGEENLLCLAGDPYSAENILIHEFAHAIHEMALRDLGETFDGRLNRAYATAIETGLWKGSYAASKPAEYWAEGAQAWFDAGRVQGQANLGIGTREKLKAYDPALAGLVEEVFGNHPWRYVRPAERRDAGHLAGMDRDLLPRFAWPTTPHATNTSNRDEAPPPPVPAKAE